MKKMLGASNEEGVEYWSENDEQTSAHDGESENKEEQSAVIDSQNENGNTILESSLKRRLYQAFH